MADATNVPIAVMETAGEGGAWGIALLASYMINKEDNETLDDFLDNKVFKDGSCEVISPEAKGVEGFEKFIELYKEGLAIEKAAVENMK